MKSILSTLLILSASSWAGTAATKICFGSRQSEDTRGVVMTAKITKKSVTLKTIKESSNFSYDGTFPAYGTKVNAKDGHVYLEYEGDNSDYQDVIMVDENLLTNNTKGLLQIRARGEGFFNHVFVCKDNERDEG